MKRVVLTALAASLLCSTAALAQDARERRGPPSRESSNGGGGVVGRLTRDVAGEVRAREAQARPPAPAPAQAAPAQPRGDRGGGFDGRRGDGDRGQGGRNFDRGSTPGQPPLAGGAPANRGDNNRWNDQGRPDGQTWQGQRRPDTDRGPDGRTVTREDRNDMRWGRYPGQSNDRDRDRDRDGNRDRDWNQNRDRDRDGRGWNNDGRGPGRPPVVRPDDRRDRDWNRPRYDERRYPRYITPRQRYQWRGPIYRPPIGFYSYRWQFGQTLPWNWYTPNYYIDNWSWYGLRMPPIGYEWVRVGNDALLINVFTGRVYQVAYNIFW